MPSQFDTLFSASALPVLQATFAEDADGDVGSGIYREDGREDQTFFYMLGKGRDREVEGDEGDRLKEQTLEIFLTSALAAKPRLNATVILDNVTWAVKEVHGTGDGMTKLVLAKGPIMQRSRPDYRMRR